MRQWLPNTVARVENGRDRSRSLRRADACRNLIAAITGERLAPRPSDAGATSVVASTRRRGSCSTLPAVRRKALCQLLLAAAGSNEAAAYGTEVERNNQILCVRCAGWAAALLVCICYLTMVGVQRFRRSKPRHHVARAHGSRCSRCRGQVDADVMATCRPNDDVAAATADGQGRWSGDEKFRRRAMGIIPSPPDGFYPGAGALPRGGSVPWLGTPRGEPAKAQHIGHGQMLEARPRTVTYDLRG